MKLPRLLPENPRDKTRTDSVLLAVYAPFGTDKVLSHYPDGTSTTLATHPLYRALMEVAECGVHVCALIDLAEDDTYLVEIEAARPAKAKVTSRWKQAMDLPNNLAGFLAHAHASRPTSAVVLAMEGHGAGYLPEIDRTALTAARVTTDQDGNPYQWKVDPAGAQPLLPTGAPLLPTGAPLLPTGAPLLPGNHMPLSTWGLGQALKSATASRDVPKLAVIHFNNCFNMSVELLHTIAPFAEYATGYSNYNFFTSGQSYPVVFGRLQAQGTARAQELADWFAEENRRVLETKGNHPTSGGVVWLPRMHRIAECVDDLADALLAALRATKNEAEHTAVRDRIMGAIVAAQQFDTEAGFDLETPDELTDLMSLAAALKEMDFAPHPVKPAAAALYEALQGIRRYGSHDRPWVVPSNSPIEWNFSSPDLAMNIFLPDPLCRGLWDWRSPYYLEVNPNKVQPPVQPGVIDFLTITDWVDFLIEYHKHAPTPRLLPAAIPEFPVFKPNYEPEKPTDPPPCGEGDGKDGKGGQDGPDGKGGEGRGPWRPRRKGGHWPGGWREGM